MPRAEHASASAAHCCGVVQDQELLAYQVAFDLVESEVQSFLTQVRGPQGTREGRGDEEDGEDRRTA